MKNKQLALLMATALVVALAVSGCAGPTTQPGKIDTPQDAVISYWEDIDSGNYNAAYDITYHAKNTSREMWDSERRAMWGNNGTNIKIYNFTVIGNSSLDPGAFPNDVIAAESVLVESEVSYYGKNTSGISMFVAVKTADGWKFFGSY